MKTATFNELLLYFSKYSGLAILIALLSGSASALFLFLLDWATFTRAQTPWLIIGLPFAGFTVGWIYSYFGQNVEAGNNLIIDEIHDPQKVIPLRMAFLVLGGTVISHLFGASVGREGTAIQMGSSLADQLTTLFKCKKEDRRIILMMGISAGFASVFGTPLAGALFGLEVLAVGVMHYEAIFPCLMTALLADHICLYWGAHHTHYVVSMFPVHSFFTFAAVMMAGMAFGGVGRLFVYLTQCVTATMKSAIHYAPLCPLFGGSVIALIIYFLKADRYSGLGIPVLIESFQNPLMPYDWSAKLAITALSLGSGFKGGEVTPLFYIGATLGNALAPLLHMPMALMAATGFVAVFAGAANTPLSCTIMAMELFGAEIGSYAALACVMSYLCSGYRSIYRSQRMSFSSAESVKLSDWPAYQKKRSAHQKTPTED